MSGPGWGLALGLLLALPAAAWLRATGYPSDELYLWWLVLGACYVGVVAGALVLGRGRPAPAAGFVAGATLPMLLVPLLVVVDIVAHSAWRRRQRDRAARIRDSVNEPARSWLRA